MHHNLYLHREVKAYKQLYIFLKCIAAARGGVFCVYIHICLHFIKMRCSRARKEAQFYNSLIARARTSELYYPFTTTPIHTTCLSMRHSRVRLYKVDDR